MDYTYLILLLYIGCGLFNFHNLPDKMKKQTNLAAFSFFLLVSFPVMLFTLLHHYLNPNE